MFEENEEHITHEDSNDAAVNENCDDKTIGIEDIPSPTDPDDDKIQDTPYPSGFFQRLLYTCFCKCFS
ncbi:CCP [Trifolium medium]|uniref:CCP n=1 Tax=Trifolium medium TaxID=97028 RepID=A0A392RZC4_9FABA|nr:CCP [Trifolium medium]